MNGSGCSKPPTQSASSATPSTPRAPAMRVGLIAQTARGLAVQPTPSPEGVPGISLDDAHLVCWPAPAAPDEPTTIIVQLGGLPHGDKL